jgi:hypothetical protein
VTIDNPSGVAIYSLCPIENVILDFETPFLTVRLIQNFYANNKINKLLLKYL